MTTTTDRQYSYVIGLATLAMAISLTDRDRDEARAERKRNVVERKWAVLRGEFTDELGDLADGQACPSLSSLGAMLTQATGGWDEDRRTLLIDLVMADPFAPYELAVADPDQIEALRFVATFVELTGSDVADVVRTRDSALAAHRQLPLRQILTYGVVGTVLFAVGGFLIAPVLAGALGAAAGLSGAAATAHGLALLGGGSLAAGGAGMAGGMWLVTGVGGLAGGALAGGGRGLLELGAGQARVELVKLQMSYKLNVLHTTGHIAKAQAVAKKLQETQDELKRELEVERQLNDKNARRLKDIEEKLKAVEAAQAYVDENEPVAA